MKTVIANPIWQLSTVDIPLNIIELSGYLRYKGIDCDVVDLNLLHHEDKFDRANLIKMSISTISSYKPDIVGITSNAANLIFSIELGRALLREGLVVVLGGIGASGYASDIIRLDRNLIILRGEGELAFEQLISNVETGAPLDSIPGLLYASNRGDIIDTGTATVSQSFDVNRLPAIRIEHTPYIADYAQVHPGAYYSTMRGCYFRCAFCAGSSFTPVRRYYDLNKVNADLATLKSIGMNHIQISDDCFTGNRMRADRIMEMMRSLKMGWGCQTRIDALTEDTINRMSVAGCKNIYLGIESASRTVLRTLDKHIAVNPNVIKDRVRTIAKRGIMPICSFMMGVPTETEDDISQSLDLALALQRAGATIQWNYLTPLPGIRLNDKPEFARVAHDKLNKLRFTDIMTWEQRWLHDKWLDKYASIVADNYIYKPKIGMRRTETLFRKCRRSLGLVSQPKEHVYQTYLKATESGYKLMNDGRIIDLQKGKNFKALSSGLQNVAQLPRAKLLYLQWICCQRQISAAQRRALGKRLADRLNRYPLGVTMLVPTSRCMTVCDSTGVETSCDEPTSCMDCARLIEIDGDKARICGVQKAYDLERMIMPREYILEFRNWLLSSKRTGQDFCMRGLPVVKDDCCECGFYLRSKLGGSAII